MVRINAPKFKGVSSRNVLFLGVVLFWIWGFKFAFITFNRNRNQLESIKVRERKPSGKVLVRNKQLLEFHRQNFNLTRSKRLPNIIGIGAEKCGTGWFQFALQHHPMIKVGLNEAHFFNHKVYTQRGLDHYKNIMPEATDFELIMEKTPGYFNFLSMDTPGKIKRDIPHVKLWLILCDPVQRTFSDFVHERDIKHLHFRGSFKDYVAKYSPAARLRFSNMDENTFEILKYTWHKQDADSHILTVGVYYYPLKRWMKRFSPMELFIASGEELQHNSGKVIEQVQEFLGIPLLLLEEDFERSTDTGLYCINPPVVVNSKVESGRKRCYTATKTGDRKGRTRSNSSVHKADDETLQKLKAFFRPYDELLFSLLGKELW